MNNVFYEICSATVEVRFKDYKKIVEGVTINYKDDIWDKRIEVYETLEQAREALKKYHSTCDYFSDCAGGYFDIEEYYIQEVERIIEDDKDYTGYEYDDYDYNYDGGIWEFTPMPEVKF